MQESLLRFGQSFNKCVKSFVGVGSSGTCLILSDKFIENVVKVSKLSAYGSFKLSSYSCNFFKNGVSSFNIFVTCNVCFLNSSHRSVFSKKRGNIGNVCFVKTFNKFVVGVCGFDNEIGNSNVGSVICSSLKKRIYVVYKSVYESFDSSQCFIVTNVLSEFNAFCKSCGSSVISCSCFRNAVFGKFFVGFDQSDLFFDSVCFNVNQSGFVSSERFGIIFLEVNLSGFIFFGEIYVEICS